MTVPALKHQAKNAVILLDDDPSILEDYAEGLNRFCEILKGTFEILTFESVDDAIKCAEECRFRKCLWLIDCMMPHGTAFTPEETDSGMLTGIAVAGRLLEFQKQAPAEHFGIFMLTNLSRARVEDAARALPTESRLTVLEKVKYSPRKLSGVVTESIQLWQAK